MSKTVGNMLRLALVALMAWVGVGCSAPAGQAVRHPAGLRVPAKRPLPAARIPAPREAGPLGVWRSKTGAQIRVTRRTVVVSLVHRHTPHTIYADIVSVDRDRGLMTLRIRRIRHTGRNHYASAGKTCFLTWVRNGGRIHTRFSTARNHSPRFVLVGAFYRVMPALGYPVATRPGGPGRIMGVGKVRVPYSLRRKKPAVRIQGLTATGFCKKGDIRSKVYRRRAAFLMCYSREAGRKPRLAGRVTAQWAITLRGQVKTVHTSGSLTDRSVKSCVARTLRRIRFHRPQGGQCMVRIAFVFDRR